MSAAATSSAFAPTVGSLSVAKRRSVLRRPDFAVHLSQCSIGTGASEMAGEHRTARIAVVLRGGFRYRSRGQLALLTRGSLLLADAGQAYGKRSVDGAGDTCLVFEYRPEFLREVDRAVQAPGDRLGAGLCLPPSPSTAAGVASAERALRQSDDAGLEEAALRLAELALSEAQPPALPRPLTADQEARITAVVRHIEAHYAEDCSLARLAELAGLSTFHTLRLFRAFTGQTPRQWLLAQRLMAASDDLQRSGRRVIEVAMDAGFSDVSHFNAAFRRCYGVSPTAYRARAGRATAA